MVRDVWAEVWNEKESSKGEGVVRRVKNRNKSKRERRKRERSEWKEGEKNLNNDKLSGRRGC